MRPLIGVTTSEVREVDKPTDQGEPPQREMTLGLHYLDLSSEYPDFEVVREHDRQAQERGIALIPGVGFGVG